MSKENLTEHQRGMMRAAAHQIRELRRQNELLAAKVDGFETAAALFYASPPRSGEGAEVDYAWALEQEAAEPAKPGARLGDG